MLPPGVVPDGGGRNLMPPRQGGGGRETLQRKSLKPGGAFSRPVLKRPEDQFRPGTAATVRIKPAWQKQWGKWGNWTRDQRARTLDAALINSNYRRSLNWSYRPGYWGSRPWWSSRACHTWHRGHWHFGWNPRWHHHHHGYYPRPWPGYAYYRQPVAWGLVGWGLGSLIYDTGYCVYTNPYLPPPYVYAETVIRYDRPMSVLASGFPSGDESQSNLAAIRSAEAMERSRAAFMREDYPAALQEVDAAIAEQPGDVALHEYRALVLFALGKYHDAAGVLNPVLASGPGWTRATMLGFYRSEESYAQQLAKLEAYAETDPGRAAPRFLLAYHYLVGGDLERAAREFDGVVRLRPDDDIARQLRDLARNSTAAEEEVEAQEVPPETDAAEDEAPPGKALAAEQLVGTWTSNRGEKGTVILNLRENGSFEWTFTRGEQTSRLTGTYEIDGRGLLVLSSEDSQMVGRVALPSDKKMTFVLEGGPEGDPGLSFELAP